MYSFYTSRNLRFCRSPRSLSGRKRWLWEVPLPTNRSKGSAGSVSVSCDLRRRRQLKWNLLLQEEDRPERDTRMTLDRKKLSLVTASPRSGCLGSHHVREASIDGEQDFFFACRR